MSVEEPTEFPELNGILAELIEHATASLGDNFVGAYLQGSFALGDADEHSDVDFLIPTQEPVTPRQEAALREMHAEFPSREVSWAQHLEGSYPPIAELWTLDAAGRPWLYVDNGATDMEWSTHCNTPVARWTVREHGVVLAGPDPKTLVDIVTPTQLRRHALAEAQRFMPLLSTWADLDNAWTQPYVVATFCRCLHTLDVGAVTSKRQAMRWARDSLDPAYRDLIQQALDDRPDPWVRVHQPARPGSVAQTLRFASYAEGLARSRA
jgi:predicted nucleotidyltransferase